MKRELSVNLNVDLQAECWNFLRLAVLLTDDIYYQWYFEKFNEYFVDENLAFHFYEWGSSEFYSTYDEVLSFQEIEEREHLSEKIMDAINREDYVTIYWDRYYIPGTLQYGKEHKLHGVLIHGYDDEARTFKFVDYEIRGILWSSNEISFDILEEAFGNAIEIMAKQPEQWNWIYQNNLPASIVHVNRDFQRKLRIESIYTSVKKNREGAEYKNLALPDQDFCNTKRYGINAYQSYYDDLYHILLEKNPNYCNEAGNEFLLLKLKGFEEAKKSFSQKIKYLKAHKGIDFSEECIEKTEAIPERIHKAYLLFSKHAICFKKDLLEKAREILMEAQQLDREVLSDIQHTLEKEYMFPRIEMKGKRI